MITSSNVAETFALLRIAATCVEKFKSLLKAVMKDPSVNAASNAPVACAYTWFPSVSASVQSELSQSAWINMENSITRLLVFCCKERSKRRCLPPPPPLPLPTFCPFSLRTVTSQLELAGQALSIICAFVACRKALGSPFGNNDDATLLVLVSMVSSNEGMITSIWGEAGSPVDVDIDIDMDMLLTDTLLLISSGRSWSSTGSSADKPR